ncbi:MAG: hypothetical protein ABIZ34_08045 [Candidatus Limnocylindrales bacterium]
MTKPIATTPTTTQDADASMPDDGPLARAELAAAIEAATEATDALPGDRTDSPDQAAPSEHLEISQTGGSTIAATSVSVLQSGVSRINARDVNVTQSGVALVRTDLLRMEEGSNAAMVISRRAQLAPESRVMVLVSRQTSGDVRPVFDWRSALALVVGYLVLRRVIGRLLGR